MGRPSGLARHLRRIKGRISTFAFNKWNNNYEVFSFYMRNFRLGSEWSKI